MEHTHEHTHTHSHDGVEHTHTHTHPHDHEGHEHTHDHVHGAAAGAEKNGGIWRVALTGDLSDAALAPRFSDGAHDDDRWDGSAAAFDGERLAVLYTLPSRETTSLPDVGLTVLDQTGTPVFAARYRRSGHFDQASRGLLSYSPGRYHWTEDPSAILAFS